MSNSYLDTIVADFRIELKNLLAIVHASMEQKTEIKGIKVADGIQYTLCDKNVKKTGKGMREINLNRPSGNYLLRFDASKKLQNLRLHIPNNKDVSPHRGVVHYNGSLQRLLLNFVQFKYKPEPGSRWIKEPPPGWELRLTVILVQ